MKNAVIIPESIGNIYKKQERVITVKERQEKARQKKEAKKREAAAYTPLLGIDGQVIEQISGKGQAKGIIGKNKAMSDEYRKMAYEYRKKTGKRLSQSKQFQEKIKDGASKSSYFSAESAKEIKKINDYANRPILTTTNALDERKIRDARNIILKSVSLPESRKLYNEWIKYDSAEQTKKIKVMPFKTVSELEFEKKLSDFTKKINANKNYTDVQKQRLVETFKKTGSASISEQVKKSIKATPQTLSESRKVFDKAVSAAISLPTLNEIATGRDSVLESAGMLETQRKLQKVAYSDPAAKAVLDFTEKEYEEIRTQPATYASGVAALAVVGAGFGAGAKGFSLVTKGVSRKVLGKQLAKRAVLGSAGKSIPLVGKVAVEQLPTIALDTFFVSQIGKEVVKGAKIEGKPISELGGVSSAIAAKRAGKDIQWVTEQNLEIAKDLAVMAPFVGVGGRAVEKVGKVKIEPMKFVPKQAEIGYGKIKRSAGYSKVRAKYKAKKILSISELNRFMKDTRAELSIERTRERTVEKTKTKGEITKLNNEIAKTQEQIQSKEKLIKMANERGLRQKAKELVIEQMELEMKLEGLKEGKEKIKSERLQKGKETVERIREKKKTDLEKEKIKEIEKERKRGTIRNSREIERKMLKNVVVEKERVREIEKTIEKIKEIEKTIEKEVEKEIEIEKTIEKTREKEIEREREREREKEKEKEKERERLREKEIILPILKFDRDIAKKLTSTELDKFVRASRTRKNKLGTISSVLGGGTTKTPKKKLKMASKTTRKTKRKVSA